MYIFTTWNFYNCTMSWRKIIVMELLQPDLLLACELSTLRQLSYNSLRERVREEVK